MDLENDELDITKLRRKKIHYTKLVANNKGLTAEQFKEFYQDYCELYDIMCDYMNAYNRECADYEQTIDELYQELDRYRKLYHKAKEEQTELQTIQIILENGEVKEIPIDFSINSKLKYIHKVGDKWYAKYEDSEKELTSDSVEKIENRIKPISNLFVYK